jgi:hypothetical protein
MKKQFWYLWFAAGLLAMSAVIYMIHYAVFNDAHHIYVYLLGDLAFLPLSVLLVTLVVDRLLSERDRRASIEKMNMVIGAFFSEVGTELIRQLVEVDPDRARKMEELRSGGEKDAEYFSRMKEATGEFSFRVSPDVPALEGLRDLLVGKRDFMVRLLENPLLLEHESFTDVLWAVFHLSEELERRVDFTGLPPSDLAHLAGDSTRAYKRLTVQWMDYMKHLQKAYPYLFSLALRLNPFDPSASVVVE